MSHRTSRLIAVTVAVLVALLVQVTVLPHFAWRIGGLGVIPDLVLLVVVAVALVTDTRYATLTGFFAGVLTDLAPPADHVAGRGALALMIVGYVIGRLAHDHVAEAGRPEPGEVDAVRRPPLPLVIAAAAGGSFIGTTVFALTGLVLGDSAASVADLLPVVLVALVMDVVAALVVVPAVLALLGRPTGRQRSERSLAGTTRRMLARS